MRCSQCEGSGSKEMLQMGPYRMPLKCETCAGFGKLMVPRDKAKRKRVECMTVVDAQCKWLKQCDLRSHWKALRAFGAT